MAGALDVIVRFVADSSALQADVASIDKKLSGFGSGIKKAAGGLIAGLGAGVAVKEIGDVIGAASELQDQIGATGVIFGQAGDDVVAWSKTTAESAGIAGSAALEAANLFAAFGKQAGLGSDDLATFSSDLVQLAGNLSSFRGTSTDQAITAIGAALRGETEPIRAYGVMLDDATLKARALSMGLVSASGDSTAIKSAMLTAAKAQETYNKAVKDHGEGSKEAGEASTKLTIAQEKLAKATQGTVPDLTQQQKVLAAEQEIYAQTADAQGDFARTSSSTANQQKILAAKLEDTKAAIGTALLPAVEAILPVLSNMADFVAENSSVLLPMVGVIAAVTAGVWLWNAALAANPVVLVTIAIAGLVAGLIVAYQNVEGFRNIVDTSFAAIVEFSSGVAEGFMMIVDGLVGIYNYVAGAFQAVKDFLAGPFSAAWVVIGPIINGIQTATQAVIDWFMTGPLSPITAMIVGPFQKAADIITDIWDGVMALFGKDDPAQGHAFGGGPPFKAAGALGGGPPLINRGVNIGPAAAGAGQFAQGPVNFVPVYVPRNRFHASGGIFTSPHLGVIAESGPEAVVPLDRWGGMGDTYNVTVNTTGLGADSVQIQTAVVDALRQHTRRNGPLAGGITG